MPVPKVRYQYHLYLALQCYTLFAGTLSIHKRDGFLNIDEGQDLSSTEYKMLRKIHGDALILNIYGDVNQNISSKGTGDWNKIDKIDQLFTVNENYRNTEQITMFCNKELGLSVTSIGILGAEVQQISFGNALKEIEKTVIENRGRCVIIAKQNKIIENIQQALLLEEKKIRQGTICILRVEEVKRLEFEKAIVFDEGMTKNEKYISYTRALEELIVVRS